MLKSKLSWPNPTYAGLSADKTLNKLSQNFCILGSQHWAAQYSGAPDKTLSVHSTQGNHITLTDTLAMQYTRPIVIFTIQYTRPFVQNRSFQTGCFFSCVIFNLWYVLKKFSKHSAMGHVCLFLVGTQRGRFGQCTSVDVQADLLQTCNILFFVPIQNKRN